MKYFKLKTGEGLETGVMRKLDKRENIGGFEIFASPCPFMYSFAYPHDRMWDYQGTLVMFKLTSVSNY